MPSDQVERVAVFDINGTLYNKKSKEEFFKFICYRNSYKLLDIYNIILFNFLAKIKAINQTQFKENFFTYLDHLPPDMVDQYAREYWSIEYPRYFNQELLEKVDTLRQQGVQIFCISGGLDIYMNPLYELFPVDAHMSTHVKYDGKTYKVIGEACKGEEKIRRLDAYFQGKSYRVVEAYSDSEEEILDIADEAFIVKKGRIEQYKKNTYLSYG